MAKKGSNPKSSGRQEGTNLCGQYIIFAIRFWIHFLYFQHILWKSNWYRNTLQCNIQSTFNKYFNFFFFLYIWSWKALWKFKMNLMHKTNSINQHPTLLTIFFYGKYSFQCANLCNTFHFTPQSNSPTSDFLCNQ